MSSLDFLVVQDIFQTETTRLADVVLPGASFAEKDGTFTNGERRVQRIRKAVEPVAGLADWEVICKLSTLMGYPMTYNHPSEIMDEISGLVSAYGGINYTRIEDKGIQWPCPTKDHPGTTTLYTERFARPGGLALFIVLDHIGSGEVPDEDFPMVLITGRVREHHNNGSQTRHAKGIIDLVPEELVEINSEDAERLGIEERGWVRVSSRRGQIKVRAKITDRSQVDNVFMTFHHKDICSLASMKNGTSTANSNSIRLSRQAPDTASHPAITATPKSMTCPTISTEGFMSAISGPVWHCPSAFTGRMNGKICATS